MSAAELLGRAIDQVRVNRVWREEVEGRARIYKRRRLGMGVIIALGNVFLNVSRSRIVMFPFTAHWQAWELHCFELANGDALRSGRADGRTIWTERMPGSSLRQHLRRRTLEERMLAAAGAEIARVHRLHSGAIDGPLSHGDLHLENALFDRETGRVRVIDFETAHEMGLDATARHADDLLVPILDLIGSTDGEPLIRYARALVEGYDNPNIRAALRERLIMPAGLELVLWHTRTSFIPEPVLASRIEAVRDAV